MNTGIARDPAVLNNVFNEGKLDYLQDESNYLESNVLNLRLKHRDDEIRRT